MVFTTIAFYRANFLFIDWLMTWPDVCAVGERNWVGDPWRHFRMCVPSSREKEIVTDSPKVMASREEKASIRSFVCEQLRAEPDLR